MIKTHKDGFSIRPVVNNIQSPRYKLAKFLTKKLQHVLELTNEYTAPNSSHAAKVLTKLVINQTHRMATFDIKDLYGNILITEIIQITANKLEMKRIDPETRRELILLLDLVRNQNYFQFRDNFYKPEKGVAMGSPISGLVAEISLQHFEGLIIKHLLEDGRIKYYTRYVDDIMMIYDSSKILQEDILSKMNMFHHNLIFKLTPEQDNAVSFLDLIITKKCSKLNVNIYRKPTTTGMTLHATSNHPPEHEMVAYRALVHRMHNLPLSETHRKAELETIKYTAKRNVSSTRWINRINNKIINRNKEKQEKPRDVCSTDNPKWVAFIFHNPPNPECNKHLQKL
ncbi:hypothetical protein Cfor_09986 [Coptotermes formosanus]|jgi:hypothetical protein|uniref:Reverse transcriptase domain-containing protein n=1 Tax=Coptotermes formosanus TaxID=36987 RepID=A0A6L2PU35_COPFO|nr:hypothetical protein Cfor_09986 [Coptotermes formosanus]